jgi:WD40 repeat protein
VNNFHIWQVFCHTSKAVTGSFPTGFDILRISVNGDFIFTATRSGTIEVWLRERVTRVASIEVGGGGYTRVTCLASDMDGGMLYAGTSDGKIQVIDKLSITDHLK